MIILFNIATIIATMPPMITRITMTVAMIGIGIVTSSITITITITGIRIVTSSITMTIT